MKITKFNVPIFKNGEKQRILKIDARDKHHAVEIASDQLQKNETVHSIFVTRFKYVDTPVFR